MFLTVHPVEEILDERVVCGVLGEQAEFGAHALEPVFLEGFLEGVEGLVGEVDGGFFVVVEERDEGFCEACEVPAGDGSLLVVGVAAVVVDGAEGGFGVEGVDEGAGAVVDGFAGEGHVVGVHDAVDEADGEPLGDE